MKAVSHRRVSLVPVQTKSILSYTVTSLLNNESWGLYQSDAKFWILLSNSIDFQ